MILAGECNEVNSEIWTAHLARESEMFMKPRSTADCAVTTEQIFILAGARVD